MKSDFVMHYMPVPFENIPVDESLLLSAMGTEDRLALMQMSRPKVYPKGMTIFSAGEPGSLIVIIESGRVEISVTSMSGRKSVLNHMGAGEVLGEIAMLDGGTRSADAVAASDVQGRILSRQHIMAFLAERPAVTFALIGELCSKVRNASDMYASQAQTEGGQRLARGLLRLFDKWGQPVSGGGLGLTEKFSQGDIGEFTGLARENVNRYIRSWTDAGIFRVKGRQLVLLDRDQLEEIADV